MHDSMATFSNSCVRNANELKGHLGGGHTDTYALPELPLRSWPRNTDGMQRGTANSFERAATRGNFAFRRNSTVEAVLCYLVNRAPPFRLRRSPFADVAGSRTDCAVPEATTSRAEADFDSRCAHAYNGAGVPHACTRVRETVGSRQDSDGRRPAGFGNVLAVCIRLDGVMVPDSFAPV